MERYVPNRLRDLNNDGSEDSKLLSYARYRQIRKLACGFLPSQRYIWLVMARVPSLSGVDFTVAKSYLTGTSLRRKISSVIFAHNCGAVEVK